LTRQLPVDPRHILPRLVRRSPLPIRFLLISEWLQRLLKKTFFTTRWNISQEYFDFGDLTFMGLTGICFRSLGPIGDNPEIVLQSNGTGGNDGTTHDR
jgi:hypothetical protein